MTVVVSTSATKHLFIRRRTHTCPPSSVGPTIHRTYIFHQPLERLTNLCCHCTKRLSFRASRSKQDLHYWLDNPSILQIYSGRGNQFKKKRREYVSASVEWRHKTSWPPKTHVPFVPNRYKATIILSLSPLSTDTKSRTDPEMAWNSYRQRPERERVGETLSLILLLSLP